MTFIGLDPFQRSKPITYRKCVAVLLIDIYVGRNVCFLSLFWLLFWLNGFEFNHENPRGGGGGLPSSLPTPCCAQLSPPWSMDGVRAHVPSWLNYKVFWRCFIWRVRSQPLNYLWTPLHHIISRKESFRGNERGIGFSEPMLQLATSKNDYFIFGERQRVWLERANKESSWSLRQKQRCSPCWRRSVTAGCDGASSLSLFGVTVPLVLLWSYQQLLHHPRGTDASDCTSLPPSLSRQKTAVTSYITWAQSGGCGSKPLKHDKSPLRGLVLFPAGDGRLVQRYQGGKVPLPTGCLSWSEWRGGEKWLWRKVIVKGDPSRITKPRTSHHMLLVSACFYFLWSFTAVVSSPPAGAQTDP